MRQNREQLEISYSQAGCKQWQKDRAAAFLLPFPLQLLPHFSFGFVSLLSNSGIAQESACKATQEFQQVSTKTCEQGQQAQGWSHRPLGKEKCTGPDPNPRIQRNDSKDEKSFRIKKGNIFALVMHFTCT